MLLSLVESVRPHQLRAFRLESLLQRRLHLGLLRPAFLVRAQAQIAIRYQIDFFSPVRTLHSHRTVTMLRRRSIPFAPHGKIGLAGPLPRCYREWSEQSNREAVTRRHQRHT